MTVINPGADGFSCAFERDRWWDVVSPDGQVYKVSDYNFEITGTFPPMHAIDADLRYGGNWYYWETELQKRGFLVACGNAPERRVTQDL